MKHILHIITGLHRGGAETVLVTLATELSKPPYSYQQSVIYFKDGPLRNDLENLGISTYKLSYSNLFSTFPKLIKQIKPDSIHSSLWSTNIVARFCGWFFSLPVYCALHTVAEHSGVIRNYIDALFPCKPTAYIAVSHVVKKTYASFLSAPQITVIENGISKPAHLEHTQRAKRSATSPQYVIGAIGRFVRVKNYDILLDAFALVHQEFSFTQLLLVGHGPLEKSLRAQAVQLGIQDAVTFVINKPAAEFYTQFDCFVQPSAYEGFSLTAAEALQVETPIIVTGIDRQHVFVKHGHHGLVIKPNCVDELYQALKRYILNPQQAHHYAQAGKKYVSHHFSSKTMAARYNKLFKK